MKSSDPGNTFNPDYFKPLFNAEGNHFWFVSRNILLSSFLSQLGKQYPPGSNILEVGCGTGNVLHMIEKTLKNFLVLGVDRYWAGLQFARQRVKCGLIQADIHNAPFGKKFAMIGLFDVLEHLQDDTEVLQDLYELLEPGGSLVITVPAFRSFWSYFDEASHHVRRYEFSDLNEKIKQAGFKVQFSSYYMALLYPLVWLTRRFFRLRVPVDALDEAGIYELAVGELKVRPVINPIIIWLLRFEIHWLLSGKRLPFGTSLIAIAQKLDSDRD